MQRRKFIQASAATALGMSTLQAGAAIANNPAETQQLIELREYEMRLGGNRSLLQTYLKDALKPALLRKGVKEVYLFEETGDDDPKRYHLVIAYPDAATYVAAQNVRNDEAYRFASKAYHEQPADQPIYTRIQSSLLMAFTGMPAFVAPGADKELFEIRYYEGYSEDAVRRKIRMFNREEIDLFYRTGLTPVFFGDMLAGPIRPCLVYMLAFKDRAERDANWGKFANHPDWNTMKSKPAYADTVSTIRRKFLRIVE